MLYSYIVFIHSLKIFIQKDNYSQVYTLRSDDTWCDYLRILENWSESLLGNMIRPIMNMLQLELKTDCIQHLP